MSPEGVSNVEQNQAPPPPQPLTHEQTSDQEIIAQATEAAQAAAALQAPGDDATITPATLIASYNKMFQQGMAAFSTSMIEGVRSAVRSEVQASQVLPQSTSNETPQPPSETPPTPSAIITPTVSLAPEDDFSLRVASYNVTGLRSNFNSISSMMIERDVFCFQETFAIDFENRPFRWPDSLYVKMTRAVRDFSIGRGSGGVGIAIRHELLSDEPELVYESASMLAILVKFSRLKHRVLILSVYRAPLSSPAYEGELFLRISEAIERHSECSVLMTGDFNVNLGGWTGYMEEVLDEVYPCVPTSSIVNSPSSEGIEMASTFAGLGLTVLYVSDESGKALPTFQHRRKRADGIVITGRSAIDFLFCCERLASRFVESCFQSEPESGHSVISFQFRFHHQDLENGQPNEDWPPSEGEPVKSRILDSEAIWDIRSSAELLDYGSNGGGVTARQGGLSTARTSQVRAC